MFEVWKLHSCNYIFTVIQKYFSVKNILRIAATEPQTIYTQDIQGKLRILTSKLIILYHVWRSYILVGS